MDTAQLESILKVKEAYRISEDFMSPWITKCNDFYSLYRADTGNNLYTTVTRSNYVVPVIYKAVETILPRIFSVLFSVHPPIQARYRYKGIDDPLDMKLRALDQLFEYFFDHYFGRQIIEGWIKDSLIYGQSYLKVGWKLKKRRGKRLKQRSFQKLISFGSKQEYEEFDDIVEDRLDLTLVDVRDLFFSPEAQFPDPFGSAKYVIHRSRKRKSEVLKLRDSGVYGDFEDKMLNPDYEGESKDPKTQITQNSGTPENDKDDPMVTIYEYWEDERVITTANHSVLLRDEPNPFGLKGKARKKPFVACFDTFVPNELFQIGEAEPLKHNQVETSTLRRQKTDNNAVQINSGYVFHKDAEVDIESLKLSRSGMVVGVRPIDGNLTNAVMPIPRNPISVGDQDLQYLDKDAQDTSGLTDYATGATPERRETATTVQLLQSVANLRFDIKVRNYSQCFAELGYMMFERWKQFLTRPVHIKIPKNTGTGFEYVEITKDELPEFDEVDLNAPGNPGMLAKDARSQKLLQFYNAVMQNPAANPQASLQLLTLALKEAEIDGIENIIQLLETPMLPPMEGQMPGGEVNSPIPTPQPPAAPPINPMVNELPVTPPPMKAER